MQIVIVALLVVIVLILLGALGPVLYVLLAGLAAFGDKLLIVAGMFVAAVIGVVIYHAAKGDL